jgi:hypothetical protein
MLWMFQRVNYGRVTNEKNRNLPDLTPREWAMMIPTVAMAIFMGVFPRVFLAPMEPSVNRIIERIHGVTVTQSGLGTRSSGLGIARADQTDATTAAAPSGTRIPSPDSRAPSPEPRAPIRITSPEARVEPSAATHHD